jgi:hypothetical protein
VWTATVLPTALQESSETLTNRYYSLALKIVSNTGVFNLNLEIPHINIDNIGECFMWLYFNISF